MRKIVAMVLVVMMVFLTPVNMFASDSTVEHEHIHEGECCLPINSNNEIAQTRNILCAMGFHKEGNPTRLSIGTNCVEFGDRLCIYNCYDLVECERCGEELSRTYSHYHEECHRNGMPCDIIPGT